MDYKSELGRISDEQLNAMAQEPQTAFPPDLWQAIEAERTRRSAQPQAKDTISPRQAAPEVMQDIGAWQAVLIAKKSGLNVDEVYALIGRVLASDAMFEPFRQDGYPLDFKVWFPRQVNAEDVDGRSTFASAHQEVMYRVDRELQKSGFPVAGEVMWVRVLTIGAMPNHWMGRLLNDPTMFSLAGKGAYVEFRSDNIGLHFVRVVQLQTEPAGAPGALPGSDDPASIPFLPCLTPGCGSTSMNLSPAQARAFIEHEIRDDPAFQLKLPCRKCGKDSHYSLSAILAMIPLSRQPRPLKQGAFWALILHELDTAPEMTDRAFLGERMLLVRKDGDSDAGNAELLSLSILASSLAIGDSVSYARWGTFNVCSSVERGGRKVKLAIEPVGRGANIGLFFAAKAADGDLRTANLFCRNPSCGTVFSLTHTGFRQAMLEADDRNRELGATSAIVSLSCEVCGTARIVDERSFDGLVKI